MTNQTMEPIGARARFVAAYTDCALTSWERWAGAMVLGLTLALQCTAILSPTLALGLLVALALISWTTPITAFFYISCCQTLPFPAESALNPTAIGFLVWPFVALVTSKRIIVRRFSVLGVIVPFLVWYAVVGGDGVKLFSIHSEFLKAGLYALIACHYANAAAGRYLKCLLGLAAGACTVMFAFWAYTAGLPVELAAYGGNLKRGGFERIGSARVDSVMVWPPLLFGTFSIIGIAATLLNVNPKSGSAGPMRWVALATFLLSIPPLLSTMTTGAYFGFLLMLIYGGITVKRSLRGRRLTLREKRRRVKFAMVPVLLCIIVFSLNIFEMRDRVNGILSYYSEAREKSSLAASRTEVWLYSLRTICRYPIFGVGTHRWKDEIPPGYRDKGYYYSHNVFLDYGRSAGLMGMGLIAVFFFYPAWTLVEQKRYDLHLPFYLAYFSMFIFWMVLSYIFYKAFWALWILMAMTSLDHRAMRRSQRAVQDS